MIDIASANPFNAKSIIDYVKSIKEFSNYYEIRVRQYTIEQHTVLVINQFEKYFLMIIGQNT